MVNDKMLVQDSKVSHYQGKTFVPNSLIIDWVVTSCSCMADTRHLKIPRFGTFLAFFVAFGAANGTYLIASFVRRFVILVTFKLFKVVILLEHKSMITTTNWGDFTISKAYNADKVICATVRRLILTTLANWTNGDVKALVAHTIINFRGTITVRNAVTVTTIVAHIPHNKEAVGSPLTATRSEIAPAQSGNCVV